MSSFFVLSKHLHFLDGGSQPSTSLSKCFQYEVLVAQVLIDLFTFCQDSFVNTSSYLTILISADENGRVTYQISDGNNQQFFKIDGDSGLVTINRRVDSDGLDNSKIVLNISASDHGQQPSLLPMASLILNKLYRMIFVPVLTVQFSQG